MHWTAEHLSCEMMDTFKSYSLFSFNLSHLNYRLATAELNSRNVRRRLQERFSTYSIVLQVYSSFHEWRHLETLISRYQLYKRYTNGLSDFRLVQNVSHWGSCKTDCKFVYFIHLFCTIHLSNSFFPMVLIKIIIRVGSLRMKLVSAKTWRWLLIAHGPTGRSSGKAANKNQCHEKYYSSKYKTNRNGLLVFYLKLLNLVLIHFTWLRIVLLYRYLVLIAENNFRSFLSSNFYIRRHDPTEVPDRTFDGVSKIQALSRGC